MFDVNCALCGDFITQESQQKTGDKGAIIATAMMTDSNTFCYGLSGLYRWKSMTFKKDDEICNNCLKTHKDEYEALKAVTCSVCKETFHSCSPSVEYNQGWGCSSDVQYIERKGEKKLYLRCGWGSNKDCDTFTIVGEYLHEKDSVCDSCIEKLVAEKKLELYPELSGF